MKLTHNGKRFELQGARRECSEFGWPNGFTKSSTGVWYTGKPQIALHAAMRTSADDRALKTLLPFVESIDMSHAKSSSLHVPQPNNGMEWLPFQVSSVEYTNPRRSSLIADEMGLGKTLSAIGHANLVKPKKILCCVPHSAKINWKREWERWKYYDWSVGLADKKKWPDTDIVIFNYEQALGLVDYIDALEWDLTIFDESHMLKNPATRRTQCLIGKGDKKDYVPGIRSKQYLFLSGTPIENRPLDIFSVARFCDPRGLGSNRSFFETRYCNAHHTNFGWDNSGASNLTELNDYLRGTLMIRRLRREVMPQLPPKRRQILVIEPGAAKRAVEQELHYYEQTSRDIEHARAEAERLQARGDKETYRNAVGRLHSSQAILFENMAILRRETGVAMVPHAIRLIEDILENNEKVVVFAYHREVVRMVYDHFGNLFTQLTGDMSAEEKQDSVDRLQTDESVRGIVGTIPAMYSVYTLTAAHTVLFIELDWRATVIKQAEDRCDRIGQKEQVLCLHMVFDGSLGARMAARIVKKLEIEEEALD